MKKVTFLLVILFTLLTACSPRSDDATATVPGSSESTPAGNTPPESTPTPAVSTTKVIVITDNSLIETGGSEIAKITALVKDKDNVLVEGQKVAFSATGGSLKVVSSSTSEDGTATAELGLDGDSKNQDIIVSATADDVTASVQIKAGGTGVAISGPSALVVGDTANLTAILSAGNGEPISNEIIEFSSASANSITPESAITDENGQVQVEVSSTAGSDTITATALGGNVTSEYSLNVANDLLSFVSPAANAELSVSATHTISVKWFSGGVPVSGQDLVFGVTAGQIIGASRVSTNSEGVASIDISSVSAGIATITVEGGASGTPATTLDIEYIATIPSSVSVAAAPRVVNTSSTSVITATVLDVNANPVKGKSVKFETAEAFGGVLSPSAVTDSNGEAAVTFQAGTLATEEDQLVVVAKLADDETITNQVALTVNKRELNVTLGTSDNLRSLANDTQYSQPFVVQVADGSGQAVKNATVHVSYHVTTYSKGRWILADTDDPPDGTADLWIRRKNTDYSDCAAEDSNKNGSLDIGEDNNNNDTLDPQNPAVLAADDTKPTLQSGSISTDENGFGYFALVYPQSNASWSVLEITASATAQNVEAEAVYTSYLPMLAEELIDVTTNLPNTLSPYGLDLDCSNTD